MDVFTCHTASVTTMPIWCWYNIELQTVWNVNDMLWSSHMLTFCHLNLMVILYQFPPGLWPTQFCSPMTMEEADLDVELFISLVQDMLVLWDKSLNSCESRAETTVAWFSAHSEGTENFFLSLLSSFYKVTKAPTTCLATPISCHVNIVFFLLSISNKS